MKKYIIGIDIGGTKCAVLLGRTHGGVEDIITDKLRFETRVSRGWRAVTAELLDNVEELLKRNSLSPEDILCAGISCGGPLDSRRGVILSPPNLPGWDCVPIVDMIEERFRLTLICKTTPTPARSPNGGSAREKDCATWFS